MRPGLYLSLPYLLKRNIKTDCNCLTRMQKAHDKNTTMRTGFAMVIPFDVARHCKRVSFPALSKAEGKHPQSRSDSDRKIYSSSMFYRYHAVGVLPFSSISLTVLVTPGLGSSIAPHPTPLPSLSFQRCIVSRY